MPSCRSWTMGVLTDGQGRIVDFRNTVLIMTSNLGTEYVRTSGSLGFLQRTGDREVRESHEKIERALKGTFRPEFLNRVDEIITFSPKPSKPKSPLRISSRLRRKPNH
jgi:ATP-dependent Clp protease ATP-binding subunit ClpC